MTQQSRQTTSKTTAVKRAGAKKATTKTSAKGVYLSRPRFFLVSSGIFLLAVTAAVVIALFSAKMLTMQQTTGRLERINSIYKSLDIGEDYRVSSVNVFGDKRVYDWDKSRSYSSVKTFLRGDTVSNTVADLDAKIKDAGFKKFDEPYPGSVQVQYHYKSDRGEYIRLSVSSKPYEDAWQNAIIMGKEPSSDVFAMDKNAGPATVTVKVNLDDNNE